MVGYFINSCKRKISSDKLTSKQCKEDIPGPENHDWDQCCLHYHASLVKSHQDSLTEECEDAYYLQSMSPALAKDSQVMVSEN